MKSALRLFISSSLGMISATLVGPFVTWNDDNPPGPVFDQLLLKEFTAHHGIWVTPQPGRTEVSTRSQARGIAASLRDIAARLPVSHRRERLPGRAWSSLADHLNGPDRMTCPWCQGEQTTTGEHAVIVNNGDNPVATIYANPHVAWSNFDRLKQSWTGVMLVQVIERPDDAVILSGPLR